MKHLLLTPLLAFYLGSAALAQAQARPQPLLKVELGNKRPQPNTGNYTPFGFKSTYVLFGSSLSDTINLPQSEVNTCKDQKAFYELLRFIEFKSLSNLNSDDFFAFAALYECEETVGRVLLTTHVVLFSLSDAGNQGLADYVARVSGKNWEDNTLIFQTPRYELTRYVVAASSGSHQTYKWTDHSFFEEIDLGFSQQVTYLESVKFADLMSRMSPVAAVENYFGGRDKNPLRRDALLNSLAVADRIHFFYITMWEFEKYPYRTRTIELPYFEDNDRYAISYDCDSTRTCSLRP